jgi:23S rRNA (cytidine1920-2'-O)/16S rRNA (cytidine1409-2'-O)-methyltransferase
LTKTRIDKLLVDRGLVESRERARALIMTGDVLVEDTPVRKAGTGVDPNAAVRLRRPPHPFVSRGGVKLNGALDTLGINPEGWITADIGSSTGGFTHCLLIRGAHRVYAVDVDTTQLDWKLQTDTRVTQIEGNARYMEPDWMPEPVDMVTVDVSFISLDKILPAVSGMLSKGACCLALVKPQFEVGRTKVPRGGVVTDPVLHDEAVASVISGAEELGLQHRATCPSSITGKEGNREFFVLLKRQ